MVRCSNNIFFDISNANFEILDGAPTYLLSVDPESQVGCPPGLVQYTVNVSSVNGYLDPVQLSSMSLPAGATVAYIPAQVIPGNSALMAVTITNELAAGAHTLTVVGNSTGGMKTTSAELVSGTPFVDLLSPADEDSGLSINPTLTWEADSGTDSYTVQVSVDAFFDEIIFHETTTEPEIIVADLEAATTYYWRVSGSNICGSGAWSDIRVFETGSCLLQYSTDVPKAISSSGTPTITSNLIISFGGSITDINVIDLEGTHTYLNDLRFTLSSPEGTDVILINRWCGSQNNFDINLDDEAAPGLPPCPYNNGNTYRPENPLSAFIGESPTGTWILTVEDVANFDGGSLNRWALELCLGDGCVLVVSNAANAGMGSLRSALECATDGDTVTFVNALDGKIIPALSTLSLQQDVYLLSSPADGIEVNGSSSVRTFEIASGAVAGIEGLTINAGQNAVGCGILNHGTLVLKDVIVQPGNLSSDELVKNLGVLSLEGNCQINH
jgi:subtilisin-like proprotein convertase family protein